MTGNPQIAPRPGNGATSGRTAMRAGAILAGCLVLALLAACNLGYSSRPPATLPGPPVAAEFLTGVTVVSYDPFNNMLNWNYSHDTGMLTDGVFELHGTEHWQSSFWPKQQFTEGQGLSIRFKVQNANARSELVFVTGDWHTDSFRQFGVYNAVIPKGDLFQGSSDLGGYDLKGSLNVLSDTWYNLLLAIGHNGHFLAVL